MQALFLLIVPGMNAALRLKSPKDFTIISTQGTYYVALTGRTYK